MRSATWRFTIRLIVFLTPLYVAIAFYLVSDPFKVLYHYSNYCTNGKPQGCFLNRDYVSVEMFLKNNTRYHYDSFIFGNSRSLFYRVEDWQKYIDSKKCFHFDASSESIYGVNRKMKLLSSKGVKIKNAILIMDHELLATTSNSTGYLYIKHPLLSGQHMISFQVEFFKVFIDYKFLTDYIYYRITHKTDGFFGALSSRISNCDPATNEISFPELDSMIESNPPAYYAEHAKPFFKRDSVLQISSAIIYNKQKVLLQEIRDIFSKDSTHYKIIISPLYDQIKFNPEDKRYLDSIFGNKNVYDFSGINEITSSRYNYYENSHYLPKVAAHILNEVYTDSVP